MIDRYTIKFGPAVSQKELEKALNEPFVIADKDTLEPGEEVALVPTGIRSTLHQFKARIELMGDFEDIKKLSELLKQLHKKHEGD